MSKTEKRDAVLAEFMACGGNVCKGCEVRCTNVDGRTPSASEMADEIVRLRAEIDRLRRILAALREPSKAFIDTVVRFGYSHFYGMPIQPANFLCAAVAAAEKETSTETSHD